MKKLNFILLALTLLVMAVSFSSCGKIDAMFEMPSRLTSMAKTTEQMNQGMATTNEAIRQQKIGIALGEMQKPQNRQYLSPIPGDMMPAGKILAEALTADEALLLIKNYIKKINEEYFENRFPTLDHADNKNQDLLAEFEHEKLADLMMITVISGFLPEATLKQMIDIESEQGAYQDILNQILMMRVMFNSDLMLNASVLNEKLYTLGKIQKAIEYNSHVEYIARLPFVGNIELKITGFTNPDLNSGFSKKFDPQIALTNWNRIYSAAQQDFKATSYLSNEADKNASLQKQNAEYSKLLNTLNSYIQSYSPKLK